MNISYSLNKTNSSIILDPINKKNIQPKLDSKWRTLDFVRFHFTDLGRSRTIPTAAKPQKICFLKKIWYSFSQRKVVWIRTDQKETAVYRKELSRSLGISNWELSKHLRENNVINPKLISTSLTQAYSSADKLDLGLKQFCESAKRLRSGIGRRWGSDEGHKKTS